MRWIAISILIALTAPSVLANPTTLPSGAGLAARYPNDAGIGKDPAVIFHDDFESGDLRKWDDTGGTITVAGDAPASGRFCAAAPMHKGRNHGGEAKKWFTPGHDVVFARFYVKFSEDYRYSHHFVSLMGSPPNDRWRPFGKAGRKPDGTYFSTGMEAWFAWGQNPPPGEVFFYTYYADMEIDPKMNRYWGNSFFPPGPGKGKAAGEGKVIPRLGVWQCWEFMVKTNSAPDKADGEQAMWIDGKLIAHFTGIRWRTDPRAKVNCFWLQHYGYDNSDPTRRFHGEHQTAWFDDVVIATEYIGPREEK